MERKTYQEIASRVAAIQNCIKSNNGEWENKHALAIDDLIKATAPSGSGFDSGTSFDATSKPNRLVFNTSFHHMDENGSYDGWTEHSVIVTPDLASGFDMRITGRDRNQIKEYIADVFHEWLKSPIQEETKTATA